MITPKTSSDFGNGKFPLLAVSPAPSAILVKDNSTNKGLEPFVGFFDYLEGRYTALNQAIL
jgi:hypothetical protein